MSRKLLVGQRDTLFRADRSIEWIYRMPSESDQIRIFFLAVTGTNGQVAETPLILFADQKSATYKTQEVAEKVVMASKDWLNAKQLYLSVGNKLIAGKRNHKQKKQDAHIWMRETGWIILNYGNQQHTQLAAKRSLTQPEFVSLTEYACMHGIVVHNK